MNFKRFLQPNGTKATRSTNDLHYRIPFNANRIQNVRAGNLRAFQLDVHSLHYMVKSTQDLVTNPALQVSILRETLAVWLCATFKFNRKKNTFSYIQLDPKFAMARAGHKYIIQG